MSRKVNGQEDLLALRAPGGVDCDDAWLSQALGTRVLGVQTAIIGVGESSLTVRASFHDANNPCTKRSVVLKLPSDKETSRAHGVRTSAYEREVLFYRHFGHMEMVPRVFATALDEDGIFTIVMEDFPSCHQIDNMLGCDFETAKLCLSTMAQFQGPKLGDWMWAGQMKWLNGPQVYGAKTAIEQWPSFKQKLGPRLPKQQMDMYQWFIDNAMDWEKAVIPPLGVCHNDFRLDNLLFVDNGVKIIDWATVSWGPAFRDAAYFFQTSLQAETYRQHGKKLFDHYLQELGKYSEIKIEAKTAWRAFAYQTFHVVALLIGSMGALDLSTRGLEVGVVMFKTAFDVLMDVDAKRIVEEDIAYAKKPLIPPPTDDYLHPVALGENFNESFYYDVISRDAKECIYLRYGRLPNQDRAMVHIAILKEGHPTYQIELEDAPLPKADNHVAEMRLAHCWFKQTIIEPLKTVRLQVKGLATAFKNPTFPIWDYAGNPDLVEIEFDLTFQHVGTPMTWRITPRWESPSTAKGTYKIAGEIYHIDGVGQRDHSWGMRDWFSVNSLWGHMHFEDGTHIQCMTEYENDSFQQGYTQINGVVTEHVSCHVEANWQLDYKLKDAFITLQPDNWQMTIKPKIQAGHRLVGVEGRAAGWPRILCEVVASDGRKGVGLVEFFFVQNRGPATTRKRQTQAQLLAKL